VHIACWPSPEEVVAAIGGDARDAVAVFDQTQLALGEVRRVKALEKRAIKAVIERAVLPDHFKRLLPASQDFRAAAHIRELDFADVQDLELTFAEDAA
jgi:hypothetical protein